MRFPIGGERVTCHGSKLTNSLGWTKLSNSLGRTKLTNSLGQTKLTNSLGRTKLTNSLGRTKRSNSLGKQQLELSTCTWSGNAPWSCGKFVSQLASSKWFLRRFFFYFLIGRYNKIINDWSCSKQRVLFPSTSSWGKLRLRGNKTHCFPWGQSSSA